MKTFETEKNNIPEGATHYQDGTSICVFAWFKTENEINYYFAPGYENKWVELGCQSEMYDERVKPIHKPEVVEWKNGDECVYQGEVYAYQCVASWDSDACILSGKSRNSESLIDAWIDELSKPESPEEKEKRERLERISNMPNMDLEKWFWEIDAVDRKNEYRLGVKHVLAQFEKSLKIEIDKTNYRKGE